ncbi:transglutaminase family protein [Geothrix sp. PMB-07]|uniref:transglutaminase-like domain-containing protein n=1 Tax=Geothrix sp. PMB-07 TaxID=3068640 RepID=UPI0027414013|nr:transglutaminase-like domain-containing protein [Geothrix sp. PMB-07]WLT32666.1 transglutaminase-like domain-containing protein [Geothrix sp. PMB-07]
MRASPFFVLFLSGLSLLGQTPPTRTFRQWLGGQEVGGASIETKQQGQSLEIRTREWMVLSRLGQEIKQEIDQKAIKASDGRLTFTWRLQLSTEPFEGQAGWSPKEPGILFLQPAHGTPVRKEVPAGAMLWPEDLEAKLKEAAQRRHPLKAVTFSFAIQQWSSLQLEPQGPAPLPGFPDAVRFTGQETEGGNTAKVELWVSPSAGELRHRTELGGMEVLSQRSELPAPRPPATSEGFFAQTLQKLPPHPFQPWMPEWVLRTEGPQPALPEDAQQAPLPGNRWRLRRAEPPSAAESTQGPVQGTPNAEETRYLAPSPLVPFEDPAFDGLLRRMALPAGLSRWEIARRVNAFVFEWITQKDFTVGFASALEVCHTPRGDCTENGVLAVALLRRLGVPARGVTGWVGLGDMLGLHFWVEVRLGQRWVPIDPTFDQAPASALRIKLGDTDLSDLGSVGWDTAATAFSGIRWVPEKGESPSMQGDQISAPGGVKLRFPGGRWSLAEGLLHLRSATGGPWRIEAVTRPNEAQLKGSARLAGPRTLRSGWWHAPSRRLVMDLGGGRWLQAEGLSESEAYNLLDQLMAPTSSS